MSDISSWQTRTELLFGAEKLLKLKRSHVLVVGLGGVGGIAAEMICRAGVGSMTLVDGDIVEASNRNRQIAALTSTVGRFKSDVIAERLRDINPEADIRSLGIYLKEEKMESLLSEAPYDCVLDAIDTISPKLYLILTTLKFKRPLVSCMGSGARMNPELVRCTDMEKTFNCSLARVIRQRLHKHGVRGGFQAVFSPEDSVPGSVIETDRENEILNKRSVTGTVSYMPAVFGCHCAAAVIRELCRNRTD